jgi:heme oxygenase
MEIMPKEITEKCPAFKDGCPFKETDSVEALYNQLSEMPTSHQVHQDNFAAKAVKETLHMVHVKSVALKSHFQSGCPVFATSCPFKTVTTYGAPLVNELDAVVELWGLQNSERSPVENVDSADSPAATPLSKALKSGTKVVHRSAENVHFVRDFLKGSVPKDSYIELLRALYHVYYALEVALDSLPQNLKHCDFTALKRTEALAADLNLFTGLSEDAIGAPSPAAKQYVERIQRLSAEDPLMILAHAYTRYLGDLSGGQILARSAAKTYNLPAGRGVAFYNFERIGDAAADIKTFKRAYRASLDDLHLSAGRADALVQEANIAFLLNILLFEERDVAAGHLERVRSIAEISQLVEVHKTPLEFQKAYGTQPVQASGQCPFIPGPAGRAKPGQPSFHDHTKVCPWPFIWFHDPRSAVLSHPAKNAIGLVTLAGLARIAWHFPRPSFAAFLAGAFTLPWLKPKKPKNSTTKDMNP